MTKEGKKNEASYCTDNRKDHVSIYLCTRLLRNTGTTENIQIAKSEYDALWLLKDFYQLGNGYSELILIKPRIVSNGISAMVKQIFDFIDNSPSELLLHSLQISHE